MHGFRTLVWTEAKLFLREPFTVLFAFLFPLVVLIVLAGVFDDQPDPDFRGAGGRTFYVPGYLGVVIAAIGLIGLPVHLAAYRERGVLRRFRTSAVPAWSILGAQLLVNLVMAAVGSIVLVIVAPLLYDTGGPESVVGVVVAFLIGAVSFIALGFLLAALVPTARAAQAVGLTLFFPMWLLAGSGPPRAIMPEAMQTIGDLLPLTHVVTALQDPWLGFGWNEGELFLLAVILVIAAVLSLRFFRWE